jgi:hypothetical protein
MSSVAPRDIIRIGKMALADHIDQLVSRRPGMTELALAKSLFGRVGYQQRVNSTCRRLFREGHLERHGTGGPGHPFTYQQRSTVRAEPAKDFERRLGGRSG